MLQLIRYNIDDKPLLDAFLVELVDTGGSEGLVGELLNHGANIKQKIAVGERDLPYGGTLLHLAVDRYFSIKQRDTKLIIAPDRHSAMVRTVVGLKDGPYKEYFNDAAMSYLLSERDAAGGYSFRAGNQACFKRKYG